MGDIQLACILPTAGKVDNGYNYRPHEQLVSHLDVLEGRFLYATLHRGTPHYRDGRNPVGRKD